MPRPELESFWNSPSFQERLYPQLLAHPAAVCGKPFHSTLSLAGQGTVMEPVVMRFISSLLPCCVDREHMSSGNRCLVRGPPDDYYPIFWTITRGGLSPYFRFYRQIFQ